MDGFEHGILVANVGTAGGADAALKLRSFVGDNVAVKVGQQDDLEYSCQSSLDSFLYEVGETEDRENRSLSCPLCQ